MSLYQTEQPTPHPTQVRAIAYELALKETARIVYTSERMRDAAVETAAKRIEKYLWGGFAPVEKPDTPLSTVDAALGRAADIVQEMADNATSIRSDYALLLELKSKIERCRADAEELLKG